MFLKLKKILSLALASAMVMGVCGLPVSASTPIGEDLDKYAYDGNDLGAIYSSASTTFKVWSPTATKVQVKLYKTGSDSESGAEVISTTDMTKNNSNGVWSATINGDLKNTYYTYLVTVDGNTNETVDIYAKAAGVNGNRGMIVDLDSTDPAGWENDKNVFVENQTDAIIWELHVKDFSNAESSGISNANRGKYLAFTEKGTTLNNAGTVATGIDYLSNLGINYVHLNPVYDFGSVDETSTNAEDFNWGYDPKNYNVPEGSYSTNPYDGNVRITEFKQMVQSLHKEGIGVVMDVVYNHTYTGADSWFNLTVPSYYYRQKANGKGWSNGSGCGNDTASENAMFRKYMVDSVVYWATEYHIDGFRFDLMGLHDVDTMNAIREALDALPNGEKILMYGEAWNLSTNSSATLSTQPNMYKLSDRIAAFSDTIRDGIKGSVFDTYGTGWAQGDTAYYSNIKTGILAATNKWANVPTQTVTYVSCHDNHTLYDRLVASVYKNNGDYNERYDDLVEMNKLASAITLTSQGMTLFLAGEEFARTKQGDHNSYCSDASLNQLDWTRLETYSDLVSYYQGLIEIRKAYSPFRDATKTSIDTINFFTETDGKAEDKNVLGYTIENKLNASKEWNKVAVIFNSSTTDSKTITLPNDVSEWVIVANNSTAGVNSLGVVNDGKVTLPASSAVILVDKASFDSAKITSNRGVVTVKHVDENNNEITSSTISGTIGSSFSVSADVSLLTNYNLVGDKTQTGTYTSETQTVTFKYSKYNGNIGTVTIKYVDSNNKELSPSVTLTGRENAPYYTSNIPTIEGYNLKMDSLPTNGAGKFSSGETEVKYIYEPVSEIASDDITIHYYNSNKWSTVNIYAYINDGEVVYTDGWPGSTMNDDGNGWWSYTFSKSKLNGANIIQILFNNGGSAQEPGSNEPGYQVYGEVWIKDKKLYSSEDCTTEFGIQGVVNYIYMALDGTILDKVSKTGVVDNTTKYVDEEKSFTDKILVSSPKNNTGLYQKGSVNVIYTYYNKDSVNPNDPFAVADATNTNNSNNNSNNNDNNKSSGNGGKVLIIVVIVVVVGIILAVSISSGMKKKPSSHN